MKVPQYRYRCPLGNLQPTTPDLDAVKREGWRNDHILVVSDDGASTMFDSPDERGKSGLEVCAQALEERRHSGKLQVVWGDAAHTARGGKVHCSRER